MDETPTTKETVKAPSTEAAKPRVAEFGDHVHYVTPEETERTLDASVMAAFTDGGVLSRVVDPQNAFGFYDVMRPTYDASKKPDTWHWPDEE